MSLNQLLRRWLIGLSMMLLPLTAAWAEDATALAQKLNGEWDAAFNRGDASGLAARYAEDAIVSPGNGKTLHGREAVRELFQGFFDNDLHDHGIEIIHAARSGDVLYQVARWQAHGTDADGSDVTYGGVLTAVLRRDTGGEWRMHVHTWNAGG